ncbi:MAG: ATP-binding protein [Planctomycetota bacterium]
MAGETRATRVATLVESLQSQAQSLSPASLELLLDGVQHHVIAVQRETFQILFANRAGALSLGCTTSSIVGRRLTEFLPGLTLERLVDLTAPLLENASKVVHTRVDVRPLEAEPEPRTLSFSFVPRLCENGCFVAVGGDPSGSDQEIADLVEDNARLEQLVDQTAIELDGSRRRFERAISGSQQGLWEWVVGTDDCWYSVRFWELLGYHETCRPSNEFKHFEDAIHEPDRDSAWQEVYRAVETGHRLDTKFRLVGMNGVSRWYRVVAEVSTEPGDDHARLSGSIIDIHDAVTAEDALRRVKRELEGRVEARTRELSEKVLELGHRNEQLDQFGRVASHDLRAPLRSIESHAQLAQLALSGGKQEKGFDHLNRISCSIERLRLLLEGIAVYSRLGRSKNQPSAVNLDQLCEDVLSDIETDIRVAGAEVDVRKLGSCFADGRMLRQVLMNLILNGIKYVKDQKPQIEVTRENTGTNETLIRVRDNGIGIPNRYKATIFEPFKRLHTTDEYAGSGVGLSVCQRIIELHHGRIWVEDNPGGGSVFCFTLPNVVNPIPAEAD